jgi:CRP/FNR family cyclic AMP-dependent transcriptional regulator
MAGKLRMILMGVEQLATLSPSARLARMLCVMSEGYGEWLERSLRQLEVRQEQLASMLCTSRQTVNQMLRDFEGQSILRLAYRPGFGPHAISVNGKPHSLIARNQWTTASA